jgi:glucan phosphoethanolaminetransferase (alkaline phosphatase superfamily)
MLACRNIYETLRFLFFVSKIFGLAPLRFDLSSSRPDRFAILWSIFVLCLTIAFVIYVTSLEVLVQYSVIVEIVETVEEFLENLISITMILLMILNRNKVKFTWNVTNPFKSFL